MTNATAILVDQLRRRRKGLELTLADVITVLYGPDRVIGLRGEVSRFERGLRRLPEGKTLDDYALALNQLERERLDTRRRAP